MVAAKFGLSVVLSALAVSAARVRGVGSPCTPTTSSAGSGPTGTPSGTKYFFNL